MKKSSFFFVHDLSHVRDRLNGATQDASNGSTLAL
jgi:hypothetical protein